MLRLLLCCFFTAYGAVEFTTEFAWTKTLQSHKRNGSLIDFLKRQLEFEVKRGN